MLRTAVRIQNIKSENPGFWAAGYREEVTRIVLLVLTRSLVLSSVFRSADPTELSFSPRLIFVIVRGIEDCPERQVFIVAQ